MQLKQSWLGACRVRISNKPNHAFAIALGVWLLILLPLNVTELTIDDIYHQQTLSSDRWGWWHSLFILFSGERAVIADAIVSLGFPWFTDPQLKIAFFRPLSTITHWVDSKLWPTKGELMHIHSIVWYGLVCALLFVFYRRLLLPGVAFLAAALFLIDFQHLVVIGWVANRNSLVAAVFTLIALLAHLNAVQRSDYRLSWLAAFAMLLALLAGEVGVASAGYLLGISIFLDPRNLLQRFLGLLPFGVLGSVWLLYYISNGYGVEHSGFYQGFLSGHYGTSLARIFYLAATFVGGAPTKVWPDAMLGPLPVVAIICLLVLPTVLWLLHPVLKENRAARCLLFGAVFALVPVANADVHERNLFLFGIGGHALLALILAHWWRERASIASGSARFRSVLCRILVLIHVILSPLATLGVMSVMLANADSRYALARNSEMGSGRDVVVIHSPKEHLVPTVIMQRKYLELPVPRATYVLDIGSEDVNVEREDAHAIRVKTNEHANADAARSQLLIRDFMRFPIPVAEAITYGDMQVLVHKLGNSGRPVDYTVRFVRELEMYDWLSWDESKFKLTTVTPP